MSPAFQHQQTRVELADARRRNARRAKATLELLRKEPSAAQEHHARFKAWYCAG